MIVEIGSVIASKTNINNLNIPKNLKYELRQFIEKQKI